MVISKQLQGLKVLCLTGALAATAGIANADVTGSLWEGDGSANADNVPGGPPNVTFTAPGVSFASGGAYTIGEFLASGGAAIGSGAGELGNTMLNTHIQLTGNVFLTAGDNFFDITHDDGARIQVAGIGTPLDVPGPTAPVTTPFDIVAPATGLYMFTLDYNECCGPPAVLSWTFPNGGPVGAPDGGATCLLLSLAGVGLALVRRLT
jgi:hypothetical protein